MMFRIPIHLPIFAPPAQSHRHVTELRFSRWNNPNAADNNPNIRRQHQIEADLRRAKRFESADRIANNQSSSATSAFRSAGTPSAPSRRSIPGKASKYSKTPKAGHLASRRDRNWGSGGGDVAEAGVGEDGVSEYSKNPKPTHPAFRRNRNWGAGDDMAEAEVKIGEDGVSYVVGDAPFEFQYSYTETPKVRPVKLREPPVAPFGPATMPRPWTGRKPLSPSKKKLPEFDSFKLPPPHKKGVKPVQSPGPFLPGSGPKYVLSREEILGEPLTKEEIEELVKGCRKSRRQLNMGRDGLTHNMLENIHAHWKRRRVCKIKCLGVCTVDMDNVREQLENNLSRIKLVGKSYTAVEV